MQDDIKIVFLVGIGASDKLYDPFLKQLQAAFPQSKIDSLVWWQQADGGMGSMEKLLKNNKVLLIGHSAGGMVAVRAYKQWPEQVQGVVLLDSHQIHHINKLPSIPVMLDIMLSAGSHEIKKMVEQHYVSVVKNDKQFYQSFTSLVQWVNADFNHVANQVKKLAPHLMLHIGFTDSNYKKLNQNALAMENELWGKYGIDIQCLPMNHFDLLDLQHAKMISNNIRNWCESVVVKRN